MALMVVLLHGPHVAIMQLQHGAELQKSQLKAVSKQRLSIAISLQKAVLMF
jgi:hypothetical protein